jgi:toxin CptA
VLALVVLGMLAALSVAASEMPTMFAIPLALLAMGEGFRLARREAGRPGRTLVVGHDGRATLDGADVQGLGVHWRGAWAFASFRHPAGGRSRLAWWPDPLPVRDRRELRLAVPVIQAAHSRPPMAS